MENDDGYDSDTNEYGIPKKNNKYDDADESDEEDSCNEEPCEDDMSGDGSYHGGADEDTDIEGNDHGMEDDAEEDEMNAYPGDEDDIEEDDPEMEDDDSDMEEPNEAEDDEDEREEKIPKKSPSKKSLPITFDSDDDDEEDYEDNYLQKFDNDLNKNYIQTYHPECLSHSSDEIQKLTIVVRDENNIIIDPLHRTVPYLTKYERARVLGQRATQIENGAKPFIKVPEHIIEAHIISELELKEKKIPFIIKRPIPGGKFEYWNLKDLEMIHY